MPAKWREMFDGVPEMNSLRVSTYYGAETFEATGAFVGPVCLDPNYGTLSMTERELVATVVSAFNGCITCAILHTHNLGKLMRDHGKARRIAVNYRAVPLSSRERAMSDYAVKLTETPNRMEAADLDVLRKAGLTDKDIYHLVETVAIFNWSNRMTSGLGFRPDDEFIATISPAIDEDG